MWRAVGIAISMVMVSASAVAAPPDATTRAAARKIATEGVVALEQGKAELASQRLEKAFDLLQAPSIALWSARALVKQGKLVEGAERYLLAGRLPVLDGNEQAVQEQAKRDAAHELSELTPRIPKLVVTADGVPAGEVTMTLDGKPVVAALIGEEQQLNPGSHVLVATRGAERLDENVTLAEAETRTVALHFKANAAAASDGKVGQHAADDTSRTSVQSKHVSGKRGGTVKTLGYVALAAGGAGLLTGGVGAVIALGKRSELDDNPDCREGKCLPTVQGDVDSFRTMRIVSTVGFIAGGVLGGVGVALLLRGSSASEDAARTGPQVALRLQASGFSLDGSF